MGSLDAVFTTLSETYRRRRGGFASWENVRWGLEQALSADPGVSGLGVAFLEALRDAGSLCELDRGLVDAALSTLHARSQAL